jgi:superoxide reductase
MPERLQILKCEICGNMAEVVHSGAGEINCCGKAMSLLTSNTVDAAKEKHVPVIAKTADGYAVKVGSAEHPMEEKHYIEWVELRAGDAVYKQYLKPGQKPEGIFKLNAAKVEAREYCSLHGLWKAGN